MWEPLVGLTILFVALGIVIVDIVKQVRHPERYETPPFLRFMKRREEPWWKKNYQKDIL